MVKNKLFVADVFVVTPAIVAITMAMCGVKDPIAYAFGITGMVALDAALWFLLKRSSR